VQYINHVVSVRTVLFSQDSFGSEQKSFSSVHKLFRSEHQPFGSVQPCGSNARTIWFSSKNHFGREHQPFGSAKKLLFSLFFTPTIWFSNFSLKQGMVVELMLLLLLL
jgi:hypothetical protein